MKNTKIIETKEQIAIREAIDIIEQRKVFLGFTNSEVKKLRNLAFQAKRFLPEKISIEGDLIFCPKCSNELMVNLPYINNYCPFCGQALTNV